MRKSIVICWCVLFVLMQPLLLAGCSTKADNDKQVKKSSSKDLKSPSTPSGIKVENQKPNSANYIETRESMSDYDNNPIDKAFAEDLEIASNTLEMNYVSEEYLKAWKSEWDNIISEIRQRYQYPEDKKVVDDYKRTFEEFVSKAETLEWLNWSDTEEPPGDNRNWGTGAPSASMGEQAQLYKRQVLYLIQGYYGTENKKYNYIYKGSGAQLENKIRESENSAN